MNGILVINKPKGYTSRDIVNIISKKLGTKKVGHTGTLDPMAEGVLVLPVGRALKISELLTSNKKEYKARVILGYETDTLDITGKETKRNNPAVSEEDIKRALQEMIGRQLQEVPIYSAVKINGKKLYEYARNNIPVTLPKKEIEVYELSLIDNVKKLKDTIEFTIYCRVSKGTYIRSLIRDIALKLGTYGTMKELVRTKQGIFTIEKAYTLEDIEKADYRLIPIKEALPNIKQINLDDKLLKKVKNGQVLDSFFTEDLALLVDKKGNEIAIYKKTENNKVKPYKMIEVQNE